MRSRRFDVILWASAFCFVALTSFSGMAATPQRCGQEDFQATDVACEALVRWAERSSSEQRSWDDLSAEADELWHCVTQCPVRTKRAFSAQLRDAVCDVQSTDFARLRKCRQWDEYSVEPLPDQFKSCDDRLRDLRTAKAGGLPRFCLEGAQLVFEEAERLGCADSTLEQVAGLATACADLLADAVAHERWRYRQEVLRFPRCIPSKPARRFAHPFPGLLVFPATAPGTTFGLAGRAIDDHEPFGTHPACRVDLTEFPAAAREDMIVVIWYDALPARYPDVLRYQVLDTYAKQVELMGRIQESGGEPAVVPYDARSEWRVVSEDDMRPPRRLVPRFRDGIRWGDIDLLVDGVHTMGRSDAGGRRVVFLNPHSQVTALAVPKGRRCPELSETRTVAPDDPATVHLEVAVPRCEALRDEVASEMVKPPDVDLAMGLAVAGTQFFVPDSGLSVALLGSLELNGALRAASLDVRLAVSGSYGSPHLQGGISSENSDVGLGVRLSAGGFVTPRLSLAADTSYVLVFYGLAESAVRRAQWFAAGPSVRWYLSPLRSVERTAHGWFLDFGVGLAWASYSATYAASRSLQDALAVSSRVGLGYEFSLGQ